jgi:hypothetical protein
MQELRWPGMVFGLFGGLAALLWGALDLAFNNLWGGVTVLAASLVIFAVSAMTPSLPGWSALAFVVVVFFLLVAGSFATLFAGVLVLVACVLNGLAAWAKRRAGAPETSR